MNGHAFVSLWYGVASLDVVESGADSATTGGVRKTSMCSLTDAGGEVSAHSGPEYTFLQAVVRYPSRAVVELVLIGPAIAAASVSHWRTKRP